MPNQHVQHSGDVPLMCLQQLIVAHVGVLWRNEYVVDKVVRTVTHRLHRVLQHPLESRIAVGTVNRHHLPLEGSKWGAHGCAGTGLIGERHLVITMFQVDHRDHPPLELLLQHVLKEEQCIAVMLHLGIQAAVVDHKPPLPGQLLGDDEAGGGPLGVTGLQPASVDELLENLLRGLFPLAPEVELAVPVHIGVCLQSYLGLTVRSTDWRWEHRLSTEEGVTILLLQPDPQCLDLWTFVGLRLGFAGHLDH